MGLTLSLDGPEFPIELLDELQGGRVVFLCGAGVSAPQLPGFDQLVDRVYELLHIKKTDAEILAIKAGRFEEALGSLSRRLANPKQLEDAVSHLLRIDAPNLSNHKVLLSLSRALDNSLALVTTNFDVLFESALEEMKGAGSGGRESLAGQALPAPGSEDFRGVIHLHGRIADEVIGVGATSLVLKSSDYGDAYMRSGWAARFLFDLARCRTLVLIGYRAGDAPVRYFLNVLEADRARFSDLPTVYAFDPVENDSSQADARWDAVAVKPLPYRLGPKAAINRHESLWRDLGRLAEIIERPKAKRRERAQSIFSGRYDSTSQALLDEVAWLLRGKSDLWDVVVAHVTDSQWFEHFETQGLWEKRECTWVVAAWCGRDWNDLKRLDTAIYWHTKFGAAFCEQLEVRQLNQQQMVYPYSLAWRLLTRYPNDSSEDNEAYRAASRLQRDDHGERELSDAVAILTPHLHFQSSYQFETGEERTPGSPVRLNDVMNVDLKLGDRSDAPTVVAAIRALGSKSAERLAHISIEALYKTIAMAHEAKLIQPEWDSVSSSVPSVEAHSQNEYHDGIVHLVVLLTDLLAVIAARDPSHARVLAEAWRGIPGLIGPRMWLHALRRSDLYSSDEVGSAILSLSKDAFWSIRRELILAMEERLSQADPLLNKRIYRRILDEAPTLYSDMDSAEQGQTDWLPQARCQLTWLRLASLRRAGVLPDDGERELAAIAEQFPYITGDYSESDLFSSYMTETSRAQGDPGEFTAATADERLAIAQRSSGARAFDTQRNWSAYCSADPIGAFEALKRGAFGEAEVGLWTSFLNHIAFTPQRSVDSNIPETLVSDIFELLNTANDDFVGDILRPLVDLLGEQKTLSDPVHDVWWDRLWAICEARNEPFQLHDTERFHAVLINRVPGRLAQQLLSTIDTRKKASAKVTAGDKGRLSRIFDSSTSSGWLARGACAQNANFVLRIDRQATIKKLRPWLLGNDLEGKTLRSVMMQRALGAPATRVFKRALLRGVLESHLPSDSAFQVASLLIRPLINEVLAQGLDRWGISQAEVREILFQAPEKILEGAASCMSRWIGGLKIDDQNLDRATAWTQCMRPIFTAIWPTERRFKRPAITRNLAELCVGTGDAFPDAFNFLRHYLDALGSGWAHLNFMTASPVIRQFPRTSLDLLWVLCGPACTGQSTDLGKILDDIVAADPTLEVDRRLQWLEQRTVRF